VWWVAGENVKLRWKALIIVAITVVSLIVILQGVSQAIESNEVIIMEEKYTRRNADQLLNTISDELSNLNSTASDYASWDDTYAFVLDANPNYIASNMEDETFVNLRLNFALFFNSSGQLVYGKAFDLLNMAEIPLPQSLIEHLAANSFLLTHENLTSTIGGTILLPEGPTLVASLPILTSHSEGPIHGTLIFGRFLDSGELSHLYDITSLPLTLQILNGSSIPLDFQTANESLSKGETVFGQPLSEKTIAGYLSFKDVYGKPIFILRFDMPRDFYAQSQISALYSISAVAIVGVIFGGVTILLLEKFVLSRLSEFIDQVRKIGKSSDFKARVSVSGKDELSSLGSEINGMLSRLQKSGKQLRQITENMLDMVTFTDTNAVYKYASPSVERTLGYEPHEMLGKTIFDYVHPDDLERVKEAVQTAIKTQTPTRIEYRCRHADGRYLWLESTGSFIFDDNGPIAGTVLSSRDITERKKAEDALRKSENNSRTLVENLPQKIFFKDKDSVYVSCNENYARDLRIRSDEILGKTDYDFYPKELAEKYRADDKRIMESGKVEDIEEEYVKDGQEMFVYTVKTPVKDEKGNVVGILGIFWDITERKKVYVALLESQQKFERLFKRNPEAAVFVDVNDRVLDINPRFTELFDYSSDEALGKALDDLIVPEGKKEEAEKLTAESMVGYTYRETVRKRKDGSPIPVLMSAAPITLDDRFVGCVVLYADITERKKMEEQLKESEERLRGIVETSFNAILNMDHEGRITYISATPETILGHTQEEIKGKEFGTFLPESEAFKATQAFMAVMNGESIRGLELELRRKDGSLAPVEMNGSPLVKDGKIVGVQVVIRDVTERKRMEQELRDSEEKFRAISTSARDAIVLMDDEGRISYWNPAAERTFGYAEKEVIGKSVFETVIPERSHEAMSRGLATFKETGKGEVIGKLAEFMAARKDRTEFPIELSISTFRMKGKWHALGIARDITLRKQMEQKVVESEERLKLLIEYAPDAIYTNDLNGKFSDGNKQAETLTGYNKEELIGKNMFEAGLLSQKYLQRALESLEKNIHGEKSGPDEYELKRKDGSSVVAEISAFPVKRAGKVEVLGIARDITERKRIEQALRESQERYKSLFDRANDSLIYLDDSGKIIDLNEKAVEIFGGPRNEILGKHFTEADMIFAEDLPKLLNAFTEIISGKEKVLGLSVKNRKGEEHYLECSTSILRTADKITGILVIARDVTERNYMQKKLEEYSQHLETIIEERTRQLREAHERLIKSERLATIGQVAAMVGHDLRNPLTGINSAVYYLKTKLGPQIDQKKREMLELIERDVQYSDKIITDLIDYSREIKPELTETTPKSILKEAISLVEVPKNIQLIDATQDEPVLKMDVEKMKRVFSNFIKNALDAMPEGGKLTVSSRKSNGDVEIMFTDTGTGMAKEVMERLWTPFFTTKAKGMGLGLAICRRIIEAHGGRISVESIVGEGTTFTVTTPVEPKPVKEGGEKSWVNVPESLLSTTTKA
jgi:PAS domain S-box-containing protein